MSNEAKFVISCKNWIYHKVILSNVSRAYNDDKAKKHAMLHIQNKFGGFLKFPNNYSTGQIALLIKRHENLLEAILPIPQNPTYESSLAALQLLIKQAETIIKIYNL